MEHLEDSFIPNLRPLFKAVINPFNNAIVISNRMQAKPFIKGKKSPKMPLYVSDKIGTEYNWDAKGKLVDLKGNIVPANKNKVGQPRIWQCNFQSLYNGSVKEFARNNYMTKMKEYLLPYLEENELIEQADLGLELKFYLEKKGQGKHNIDIDNLSSVWFKACLDAMQGVIIPSDDTSVVTGLKSSLKFVNESETRLEILLWKR